MAQSQRNTFGAILLIGLGILFLVGQVFSINLWEIVGFSWPVFVLIPGVIFLALAFTGDQKMAGFAFPGMITTGTGLILWYQNATDNWQSWAYVWTLYAVFIGLALMFVGWRTHNEKRISTGRHFVNIGVIGFLVFAAFFELLIFHANSALTGWMLPLALIVVGGYLLVSGRGGHLIEKRKLDDFAFPGARTNGHLSQRDGLKREIDAAIAEGEPDEPKKV